MSKDILVDNSVSKYFCNPIDAHYKDFIKWLFDEGHLVVTQKLITEYHSTTSGSSSATNLVVIVSKLTAEGRLRKFSKLELNAFRMPNPVKKKLRSNAEDWDSIKAVMLSDRKFALSLDNNLVYDINNYSGFTARASMQPQGLPYE